MSTALTIKPVAEMLNVNGRTIYRMANWDKERPRAERSLT